MDAVVRKVRIDMQMYAWKKAWLLREKSADNAKKNKTPLKSETAEEQTSKSTVLSY